MKKIILSLTVFLSLSMLCVSCDKEDDGNNDAIESNTGSQYQYEISILTTTNNDPYRTTSAKSSTTTKQFKSRKEAEDYIAELRQNAQNRDFVIDSQYSWHHVTYGFKSWTDTKVQIEIYAL